MSSVPEPTLPALSIEARVAQLESSENADERLTAAVQLLIDAAKSMVGPIEQLNSNTRSIRNARWVGAIAFVLALAMSVGTALVVRHAAKQACERGHDSSAISAGAYQSLLDGFSLPPDLRTVVTTLQTNAQRAAMQQC